MDVYLLDNLNNIKDEIKIIKTKTYESLFNQLKKKFQNLSEYYELFIVDKNNKEILINNEEKYKLVEDILFIRETDKDLLEQSMFEINYNKLPESNRDILDQNYSCKICTMIIKNEKPYFCYNCQKIFHQKCLKDWDKESKSHNRKLLCPNCRNALPIEKWRKKLDFEDSRKEIGELINYGTNDNKSNNIMNIINDKKINKLKENNNKQHEIIKIYEKYIEKTITIFKNILNKIHLLHYILNLKINDKLNDLITIYPLNIQNLQIEDISKVINEELEQFKNYYININKVDIDEIMIDYNKMINKLKKNKGRLSYVNNINEKKINNYINNNNENKIKNKRMSDVKINEKYYKNKINLDQKNENSEIINSDKNKEFSGNNLKKEYKNKINLIYNVKKTFFSQDGCEIFGKQFIKNNKDNIDLIINDKNSPLINKYNLNIGYNTITIIIKNQLTNLSYMFQNSFLFNLDELQYLDVSNVTDFSYTFSECKSIKDISPLQNWDVSNGTTFEGTFENCTSLTNLNPLQNWNVVNSINFSFMFAKCFLLSDISGLKNWDVSNGNDFGSMFNECKKLSDLSPLKNWNVLNGENFEDMFRDCKLLSDISPLKKWNVSNGDNFAGMFWGCSSLSNIKPIINWDVTEDANYEDMFYGCSPSLDISPINKWKNSKDIIETI